MKISLIIENKEIYEKRRPLSLTVFCYLLFQDVTAIKIHGKTLYVSDFSNWSELNGTAPFELKNGEITGTTVIGSPEFLSLYKSKVRRFYS